jgi:CheY-like chemotaxis protein
MYKIEQFFPHHTERLSQPLELGRTNRPQFNGENVQEPVQASLLIVDDDTSIMSSLQAIFSSLGYRVRTAHNSFAALAEMHAEVPDILLSDLYMPGLSGFQLLSIVKRRFPTVRSVAMSGVFSGITEPSGISADAFYQKGGDVALLLKELEFLARRPPVTEQSRLSS